MKRMKKFLSLFLAVLMLLGCFGMTSFAEETGDMGAGDAVTEDNVAEESSVTVKMMNYNVAGMPSFSGKDVPACQQLIGRYVVENGFDVLAVQEDFGYHRKLKESLTGFEYATNHTGGIPGGDGLNVFTKSMPIYNEKREQWHQAYGSIAEGDLLTPKGVIYTVIEIGDGIYVDFYNLHADAFDTEGSRQARYSNYMQVATMVEQNYMKNNRPVIITGDFNQYLHSPSSVNSNMYNIFHGFCQLKDAWVEIHNDGSYTDFSKWYATGQGEWGNWDSVEKFLYKDGGGITVEAVDFKYTWIKDEAGADVSDHAAAECTFKFTKTENFTENTQKLWEIPVTDPVKFILNIVRWIFKDLFHILSHFDELVAFLK